MIEPWIEGYLGRLLELEMSVTDSQPPRYLRDDL